MKQHELRYSLWTCNVYISFASGYTASDTVSSREPELVPESAILNNISLNGSNNSDLKRIDIQ